MKDFFKDLSFDFKCPNCKKSLKIITKQVGSEINCKYCGQTINLKDDGLTKGINNVNKEIDKFSKDLKKMFK